MTVTDELLAALVLFPLAGALLTAVTPEPVAKWSGLGFTAVAGAGAGVVAVAVATTGPLSLSMGGWAVPLGISLRADGLATAMLTLTAVVGVAAAVFATASRAQALSRWYWPLWLMLLAGLNAVYLAGDLFNTYVALELVTVSAVALVALGGRSALRPALRYLFVAVLGSLGFLMAVALLYARTGTLDIAQTAEQLTDDLPALMALGLVVVSMALKTALFPLHGWLAPAHAAAPPVVSPIMSGLVIKAAFVVLVRIWVELADADSAMALAWLLGALGTVAVVWGGMLALQQTNLKRVVAYSTVAQVGYFFLLFPLITPVLGEAVAGPAAVDAARRAWQGVLLLVLAHGLAKAAMFLAAGALMSGYGTDRLYSLRGSANAFPMLTFVFGASGVALAGLPPSLGFAGKFQTVWAALESGQWWWLPVLLAGGLLTLAYTARVLTIMLRKDVGHEAPQPIPARMQWAALVLAVLALLLGLRSIEIIELLDVGVTAGAWP